MYVASIPLKIANPRTATTAKATLFLKYFRNIVIFVTKGQSKNINIRNIYLFLLPPLPSQAVATPSPPTFLKCFDTSFHRYMKYLGEGWID